MSFGFVVSFVMLNKDHVSNASDVPRIAGVFGNLPGPFLSMNFSNIVLVVATILSYAGTYLFALGSCKLDERARGRYWKQMTDVEKIAHRSWPTLQSTRRSSRVGKLLTNIVTTGSMVSLDTSLIQTPSRWTFVVQTAPLWIPLFLAIILGVPVYLTTKYDMPLETFCFIFLWIAAVGLQRFVKSWKRLELRTQWRLALAVSLNPVLVTALLCSLYFWVKSALTGREIGDMLVDLKHHRSWSETIVSLVGGGQFTRNVGAGDLANALLDAGIVSLGFKMFEYRRELWTSFAIIFATCLIFSTINVFVNVIFAVAIGLQPQDALAFCARNVTIALGVPAVQHLSGSVTMMSTLVTFSGLLFQMTGDFLFSWFRINDRVVAQSTIISSDTETGLEAEHPRTDEGKIIAAGITAGINAAAMGTSHLIERDSRCSAYSALSMTIFGVMTVALTAIPAIKDELQLLAWQ
jgi:putative effector of murein hydrolase